MWARSPLRGGLLPALAAALVSSACGPPAMTVGSVPFPAPRPVLADGAGTPLSDLPAADTGARLVVLDAPWCTPCEGVWGAVGQAVDSFPPGTVRVYRLLLDRETLLEGPDLREQVPPARLAPPPGGVRAETFVVLPAAFAASFDTERVPAVLLLDRRGKVLDRWTGFHPALADDLAAAVRRVAAPDLSPVPAR